MANAPVWAVRADVQAPPVAPATTATTTTGGHRADVQGLRALAVAIVVAYHAGVLLPGGFVGVDVFFVISGYVITRVIVAELAETGTLDLTRFYRRRIRRLVPALTVLLGVTMVAALFFATPLVHQSTVRTGAMAGLFNANTYLAAFGVGGYFEAAAEANPLLHTWSLSVEEQFYLVAPGLLALGWAVGRKLRIPPRALLAAGLLAGGVGSFVLSYALTFGRLDPSGKGATYAFYLAPARAWEFVAGALLAVLPTVAARRAGGRVVASVEAAVGLGSVAYAAVVFDGSTPFPGTAAVLPVVGTVLLLDAGARNGANVVGAVLGHRAAGWVGDRSYSWYLWHWPLIVFARALFPEVGAAPLVAAVGSLVPAWLSYRYVEQPVRLPTFTRRGGTLAIAVAGIVVPLGAGVLVERAHAMPFWREFPRHVDVLRQCDRDVPMAARELSGCTFVVPGAVGEVVSVGDSNAGHVSEAVIAAAERVGLTTVLVSNSGCPFVDVALWEDGQEDRQCRTFVQETVAELVRRRPATVVLATASDLYGGRELRSGDGTVVYRGAAERDAAWRAGLERVVAPLRAAGVDVVLVHPVPRFPGWFPHRMAAIRLAGPIGWLDTSIDRDEALALRQRAVTIESEVAATFGVRTLDLFDDLCPQARCEARVDGVWWFRDGDHLSVEGTQVVQDRFDEVLARR